MNAVAIRQLVSRLGSELPLVLALCVGAGAIVVFAAILNEVIEGDTHALDEAVLLMLRKPADPAQPIGPLWLRGAVQDITALGSTTVLALITVVAVGYLITAGKRGAAVLVAASVVGGSLLGTLLKVLVSRPRPDIVVHLAEVHSLSFPSGHAMHSAVTYLTLGALLARVEARRRMKLYVLCVAVALTLIIGASRVYLGVHYPTDVLAGWCGGAAWAILCWSIAYWLQRRGQVEKPGETSNGEEAPRDSPAG